MKEHQHHPTPTADIIPFDQKMVFAIGMLANQLFPAALAIFTVVLVQGLGLNPLLWGITFFLPRIFDAILDPIMGYVTDNTHSRWGRRRPYVLIGGIIAGLSFIAMWQLYEDNGQMYNFAYFLGWSMVFYIGTTIFSIPYLAMGYEMSNDYHERTRLMAIAQWIGQWAWVLSPWLWVILYSPDWFDSPAEGARTLSIYVGVICMILAVVPAFFCRYTSSPDSAPQQSLDLKELKSNLTEFFRGMFDILACKPFQKICAATFLIFNSFNTVAGFAWFIIVFYMNSGNAAEAGVWPTLFGSVTAIINCFLVIPIIAKLSQTIGKKNTFILSQSLSVVGYIMFWWCFSPEKPWLMFIPMPLFAFGIGGLFTIMMSMTADTCDLDELNTGKRREGTFGAIYWWMVKFGYACAGLLSGVILNVIGFDQTVAAQSTETLDLLRLAYIAVPVTGTLIAIWIMRNYDLDEDRAHDVRLELEKRRGTVEHTHA